VGVRLIGIHEYLRRLSGDIWSTKPENTTCRLMELFERLRSRTAMVEEELSYDNAKLAGA